MFYYLSVIKFKQSIKFPVADIWLITTFEMSIFLSSTSNKSINQKVKCGLWIKGSVYDELESEL